MFFCSSLAQYLKKSMTEDPLQILNRPLKRMLMVVHSVLNFIKICSACLYILLCLYFCMVFWTDGSASFRYLEVVLQNEPSCMEVHLSLWYLSSALLSGDTWLHLNQILISKIKTLQSHFIITVSVQNKRGSSLSVCICLGNVIPCLHNMWRK